MGRAKCGLHSWAEQGEDQAAGQGISGAARVAELRIDCGARDELRLKELPYEERERR